MIQRVSERWSKDDILRLFDGIIAEWFSSKYSELTEPQRYGIPLIHSGKNVLVSSPTGSGKTLTAFISVINELFLKAKNGSLEDKIYCVYISPLKALANDIHKNLEVPLTEINELAKREKMKIPKIRVGVRSGDTSQNERQKMLRKPPHIFITTPESLALALTAPKFREKFKSVKYVIVDEIHEIANNKRGVMLSLNMERLAYLAGEYQRIGLSATQAPLEEIARFLGGYSGERERDVWIVESSSRKELDLRVITPADDLTLTPYEVASEKMYDMLVDMIKKHRTTLVFTNTRSGAEHVAYKLKERGIEKLEAHHGSLSKETRLRVERDLKEGNLQCVISSTSLELGIDIGYIDLVVQIGSPKSVAKGLQRIGRSGHAYGKVAKGRFFVFELDDLVECTTLVKCAYDGKIDRIRIPKNSLDVLAQMIVALSLEKRWNVDEAYRLIRNSYCYRDLPMEKFEEVLHYLGGHVLGDELYSKIWYDPEERKFGRKRSSRMIFFMNLGTIPDEADYTVVDVEGKRLGDLSEKFVEKLQKGDVFVLGARSYEVMKISSSKVIVRDATGKRPTVPSWAGEMLPRSFDLSLEVGRFREFVKNSIENRGEEGTIEILMQDYFLDRKGARSIVSYVKEQMHYDVPTHRNVLLEGYVDNSKRYSIIFHFPFGRRVNDALSRAYAYKLTEIYGVNVGISITDDAFMLTSKKKIPIEGIISLLTPDEFESVLKDAIFNTELFKQRFRHVATRSFMVLRRYKGRNISVARQQLRSDKILKILRDIPNFPVMEETFNEILNIAMDMPNAKKVLKNIETGKISVRIFDYSNTPSIFAHSIILVGISDIVLMEDRSALLKELHMRLLEKIIPSSEIEEMLSESDVREYFQNKIRINGKDDLINFISRAPGVDVLHRRGINVFDYSDVPEEELRKYISELIENGDIVSVYAHRLLWTTQSLYPVFSTIYARDCSEILEWEGDRTEEEIAKDNDIKKKEAVELLKCMEKAYLAGRKIINGKTLWYRRDRVFINREYAIEILIRNLLYFRAPLTFEEIIYSIHVDEDSVRKILKYMVDEGVVIKSTFLPGYGEQYMLKDDYLALKKNQGVSEKELQEYRASKILRSMGCEEYFRKFIVVFNLDSLKIRGCYDEFLKLVKDGHVVYGRFLGNRPGYTLKDYVPLIAGAYRREELSEADKRILALVKALGKKATPAMVAKMSNFTQRKVKKCLRKLEENIYICRNVTGVGSEEEFPYYVVSGAKGSKDELIKRVVDGYGPLSKSQIEWFTGLEFQSPNDFRVTTVEGTPYYHFEEKLSGNLDGDFVIPREDPYAYPILNKIYGIFSEVRSHILVSGGEIKATGCLENRCDHVYVVDVEGDLDTFHSALKSSYMVVSSVKTVCKGYKKIGNYYVYGNVSDRIYPPSKVISYLLWKNRVVPGRKLKTPVDVAQFLGVIHSDFELIRAYRKIDISKYYKSELVYEMADILGNRGYGTLDTASLFQTIKSVVMEHNMKVIYEIMRKKRKATLSEILLESPLGTERTESALAALYSGNYVVKYPYGYVFVERKYSREFAIKKLFEKLEDMFGFITINALIEFFGGYAGCHELLDLMKNSEMNAGMYLNDGQIYYAFEEELEDTPEYDLPVVLAPKDPLAVLLRNIFPQPFEGYVIVKGSILGSVKATGKRKIKIAKSTSEEVEEIFREYIGPLIR